jgi:hypothetical protein
VPPGAGQASRRSALAVLAHHLGTLSPGEESEPEVYGIGGEGGGAGRYSRDLPKPLCRRVGDRRELREAPVSGGEDSEILVVEVEIPASSLTRARRERLSIVRTSLRSARSRVAR